MFNVNLIEIPKLARNEGEVRTYTSPSGIKYPSVTTVLSKTGDKTFLHEWRKRIGHEKAEQITRAASMRGTAVHKLCEKLVLNEQIDTTKNSTIDKHLFAQLRSVLVKHVDNIRCSEQELYSDALRVAGTVDLIADYKGIPSIIDFKTSLNDKKPEWITDYMLQAAMYSYMLWERTGLLHSQLVVIIGVESSNVPQVFKDDVRHWIKEAKERCERYHDVYGKQD